MANKLRVRQHYGEVADVRELNPIVSFEVKDEQQAESIRRRLSLLMKESITFGVPGGQWGSVPVVTRAHVEETEGSFTLGNGVLNMLLPELDGLDVIAAAGRLVGIAGETSVTLSEKQRALRKTIALPTQEDWQFLTEGTELDDEECALIVDKANAILIGVLERSKTDMATTWGNIREGVYVPLAHLAQQYPNVSLEDSETYQTVARFFAVNYDLAMYEFMRYPNA